ncbi:MAG: protease modulator HflC, partial [Sphingomonadaceae bacterium]|nr:protease modulator HflC [Sphingomonadaceae bacterium]
MAVARNPVIGLVLLFAALLVASASLYTVPETKQAIVLRLGKPERIVNAY